MRVPFFEMPFFNALDTAVALAALLAAVLPPFAFASLPVLFEITIYIKTGKLTKQTSRKVRDYSFPRILYHNILHT